MNRKKLQKYCKNVDVPSISKEIQDGKMIDYDLQYLCEYSCAINTLIIIEYLVSNDLINLQDNFVNYLQKASINDNFEIVQFLLKSNENFDINFNNGVIVRFLIERKKYTMAKYFMERFKGIYNVHASNDCALRLVVRYKHVDFLQYLLQYSDNFNTQYKSSQIYWCCYDSNDVMMTLLFNYDKNKKTNLSRGAYSCIFRNAFQFDNIESASFSLT